MADTLWGSTVPGTIAYGSVTDATYGLFVRLSSSQPLNKIRYYSAPSETSLPTKCAVFDVATQTIVSGTLNNSPSWSGAAGSGWVTCAYDGTVTLDTRAAGYAVAVYWPSGSKGYISPLTYPVTSGSLTAPVFTAGGGNITNAPFVTPSGSGLTFPNQTGGGGFWWGVDLQVGAVPAFQATFSSTDGNGAQTWNVVSSLNGGATPVATRVLPPSSPSGSYPHAFLVTLPVEPGQGTTYGDPLATIEALGAHNAYNLTCVEPGYAIAPWYADNPGDSSVSQESFLLQAVMWLRANFAVTGTEKVYLIGFSKSGLGGSGLLFRNPSVFEAGAFWDAPFGMTNYDGTDPDFPSSPVGGGSAAVYGTSANFTGNYELSPANLATWKAASDFGSRKRLWVGGYSTFQGDVTAYDATLTTAGILHGYALVSASAHVWAPSPGWVGPALAALFPASGSGLLMAAGIV